MSSCYSSTADTVFWGLQLPTFRNLLVPLHLQAVLEPSHIYVLLDIGEQFRARYFQIVLDTKHVALALFSKQRIQTCRSLSHTKFERLRYVT